MNLQKATKQAIRVCFNLKPNEKMVIVTDRGKQNLARMFEKEARAVTESVKVFVLEDFGKRPLKKLPARIKAALLDSDASMCIVQKKLGEVATIRRPIRLLGTKSGRHAMMLGLTEKIMQTGMLTDHKKVWSFTKRVYSILTKAREIQVLSKNGTCLLANFNKKYRWVNCNGDLRRKHNRGNLPGAEVYTYPADVNGTAIIDGVLGDWFTEKYGFLDKTPLKLTIKKGRVVRAECKNRKLQEDFKKYIKTDRNARRIGEFALGTNIFLKKMVGSMLQDEKFPGVHIAVGNPYPELTGAPCTSKVHCDGIIKKPTVFVDGKKIMENGKYLI